MKLKNAKDLAALTNERREKYAREIFDYEAVMAAIIEQASKGQGHLRIAQDLPASLRPIKAARQLVERLKAAGYAVEWVEAVERERSNGQETGGFIQYEELRVSWVAVRIHSGPQSEAE